MPSRAWPPDSGTRSDGAACVTCPARGPGATLPPWIGSSRPTGRSTRLSGSDGVRPGRLLTRHPLSQGPRPSLPLTGPSASQENWNSDLTRGTVGQVAGHRKGGILHDPKDAHLHHRIAEVPNIGVVLVDSRRFDSGGLRGRGSGERENHDEASLPNLLLRANALQAAIDTGGQLSKGSPDLAFVRCEAIGGPFLCRRFKYWNGSGATGPSHPEGHIGLIRCNGFVQTLDSGTLPTDSTGLAMVRPHTKDPVEGQYRRKQY